MPDFMAVCEPLILGTYHARAYEESRNVGPGVLLCEGVLYVDESSRTSDQCATREGELRDGLNAALIDHAGTVANTLTT